MKFLRRLLIVLAGLAVVAIVVGFFLPDRAHVERSQTISAPPSLIYSLVSDFREFNRWSPWYGLDPEAEYAYSGPEAGLGAKMTWSSDKPEVGSGSQEIVEAEPDTRVRTKLDFGHQGTAYATLSIAPSGEGSRVTWALDADFGYDLLDRYVGLMFDGLIGPQYELGLSNLKLLAEAEQG